MKSENWIILKLVGMLFVIGMASFFKTPAYEKGVWFIAGAISVALTAIMSYKFGKNMPQPDPPRTIPSTPPNMAASPTAPAADPKV